MLIEKNSNYVFFYNAADLKNIRLKNINCSGPIDKVLNEVFANTGITYLIQGNDVVLKVSKTESAQQAKKTEIVGVVTDARTGEAVIGASVAIVGTTTGVITDIDGKFVIQAGPQDVLKISYVGYTAKEVKVGNRKVLAIDLSEDAQALEEVVVTAYGTGQKKASMVGSVQAIRPAELKVPSTNLSNSFAGRLSGVVAVQRTGRPGADGSDFWIRGISTLSEATSPLIIIDGVQVSSADLNALDPEVIDGFSILKDATATAMYGTRGANGVMIVTTKSGQNLDKPIINFRVEGQISQPTKTPKFVDGATYMELFNEAVKNETGSMVCIEKGTKLRYDIDIRVRLIDYQEYSMGTLTFLKGFISGLHAGNFDISHIFIDSFYKLVEDAGVAEVEDFVLWCDKFGAANNMSFTVVVSEDPEKATEAMKAYL